MSEAATKPRVRINTNGVVTAIDGVPTRQASLGGNSRGYDAGRRDLRDLGGWFPALATSHEEILTNRNLIVARARDLVKNNPTIAGAIDRLCESVIGAMMWAESAPDYEAMGRTMEWAYKFSIQTEAKFRVWANDPLRRCDVHRKARIPEMMRAGYRHWIVDGEACAVIKMMPGRGKYRTAVELVDPDRLSNPNDCADETVLANGNSVIGGVEINPAGEPVAYHIRKKHPQSRSQDFGQVTWMRIPRYAASGRPLFIHAFRQDRAGQRRGISRLAAVMTETKMAGKYSAAELAAAIFDALNVGTITSPAPGSDVRDAVAPTGDASSESNYWDGLIDWRAKNKMVIEGLNMPVLYPGEKMEMFKPSRPNAAYPEFMADRDRRTASGIGISYPHYSGNWADINYSSGRLMRNEMWRGFMEDRELFSQEFGTPIWAAFMEEAAMLGEVKIPGGAFNFYRWHAELTMVAWQGPGPGYGDPKKEAEANEIELRSNTATHSEVASAKGQDARRVFVRRAFEKKFQEQLGLTDISDTEDQSGPGRPSEGAGSGEDGAQQGGDA